MTRLSLHAFPHLRVKAAGRVWYDLDGMSPVEYLVVGATKKCLRCYQAGAINPKTRRFYRSEWSRLYLTLDSCLQGQESNARKQATEFQKLCQQYNERADAIGVLRTRIAQTADVPDAAPTGSSTCPNDGKKTSHG